MESYTLSHLSNLSRTGIFCLSSGQCHSFQENGEFNPLYQNQQLQQKLIQGVQNQDIPYIWKDEFLVYFACIFTETGFYLAGPMSVEYMDRVQRHRFYRKYGIPVEEEKNLYCFTLSEILQTVGLMAALVSGSQYTDDQLLEANHLTEMTRHQEGEEQIRFNLKSDEQDFYRHSYLEEQKLLNMVRSGNVEEALRLSKGMDVEIGRLGGTKLAHCRNLLTVGVTLCARAAIEGGLMPYIAYRISGFYIHKGTECTDASQVMIYRNHAVEELARRVKDLKKKRHTSSYTEQCRDYIGRHFREKIYLGDLARNLGISPSYLSRLFKKETGTCLQDYINDVRLERAANLLIYSEESIPKIAEYVNFPSQSYFGKLFKEKMHMTPRQYRESYKPREFLQNITIS